MSIQNFGEFGKTIKDIYSKLFIEDLKNQLGFPPCEVLSKKFELRICTVTDQYIGKRIEDLRNNF